MKHSVLNKKIHDAIIRLVLEQAEPQSSPKNDKKDKKDKKDDPSPEAETPKPTPKAEKEKADFEGKSKIITKGAFGGGRFKEMFRAQASRAFKDPQGLLRDLGIKNAEGKSDIKKAESIIAQAVGSNKVLERAFKEPSSVKVKGTEAVQFQRATNDLSIRDATKYIYLTLVAAENAGRLKLSEGIKFLPRNTVTTPTIIGL
tara:strand:+ start:256 stop:858 length:603 start_codon:yes stop_codon:yes gene_type:complete